MKWLIFLILGACGASNAQVAPAPVEYWKPQNFPIVLVPLEGHDELLLQHFYDAAGYWNTLAGVQLFTRYNEPPFGTGVVTIGVCEEECSRYGRAGYTKWPQAGISHSYIYKYVSSAGRVAVHELGHVLGLQHHPNKGDVMYRMGLEEPWTVDPASVEFVKGLVE